MPPAFAPATLSESRAALLASAASAAFFGASPAFAQPEDGLLAQSPATRLTVPLRYDGAYRGDVPVTIDGDRVAVWTSQLVDLLGPRISLQMRERIFAAATSPVAIDLEVLNRLGIFASFNQVTLELNVSIPLDIQGAQQVSGAALIDRDERDFLRPSTFAASATVLVTQRRVWQSPTETVGFKPVQVSADLAANIGGAKGVFLFSQHTYDGQSHRFQRGNSQLVFDLEGPAIRTILGDVASLPVGFQSSPLVGGVQVQRAWNDLQPLRNIRPSGQTAIVLDRPSTVDVVVNGAVVRSLQLQPGRYDLNDLPFINGLNEVELYVQDDQGRRLLKAFSQFYNVSLLAKGLLDFNVVAGVTQDLSGTGARYRSSNAAMSGWVRYGATENMTIGANLQASRQMVMGGIEGVVATGLGAFSAVASFSRATINGVSGRQGRAFLIGYDGQFGKVGPFRGLRITADWRRTSRDFVQLDQTQQSTVKSLFQARAITQIGDSMSGGLSYVNSIGHDGTPNRRQYSAQLRRNWGRFNLTAGYDRQLVSGLPSENRFLLTANMRLGRTQDLRATHDSRTEVSRIDYSRFARDEVGALGLRAGLERTPQSVTATGQALYNTNDFRLTLDHRVFRATEGTPGTAQESVYTVSTQIAMAGGKVAYGRPVGPRFAIVSAHPTLKDARLRLTDGSIRKNPLAKARIGRPALVQLGAPYLTSRVRVDVDRLPAGYDIGPGEYRMKPTPAAGFDITVGSDASRMIMGVALDAAGQPLAQMAGTLISLDDPNAPPVLVFTNRNGRFVVSGLKPGRYELRMGNDGAWRIPVVVPKDDETTIALGTLRLAPRKASR